MNPYPPQYPGYPPPPPGYPSPSFPPYVQPAAPPPRKSRVGLWILLGCLAMFGACGALIAVLPDAPESASQKSDEEPNGKSAKAELRQDVPKGAAKTIQKARDAIRDKNFDALQSLLASDESASYRIDGDLEAKSPRAAIDAWRKNPDVLKRIDTALAAKCEVDPPDEGHILISCGNDASGSLFVMLSNMMDEREKKDEYRIYSVGEVL